MAGDPAQLPPTVTSQEAAQQHGLRVTLFERLQRVLGLKHVLLDTQYRMNPAISAFPRCDCRTRMLVWPGKGGLLGNVVVTD